VIDVVLLWDEIATRGKVMGWVVGRGNNLGSLESLEAGDNVSSDFTTTGDLVERPGFGDDDATTGDLCPSSTTMGWTSDAFREEDAALCEDDGSIRKDDFAANIKQKIYGSLGRNALAMGHGRQRSEIVTGEGHSH